MALLLSRKDVQALLTMPACMEIVENAFRQHAAGNANMPQRAVIKVEQHNGVYLAMPAYIGGDLDALGLKIVTVYGDNPKKHGVPTIFGTLVLCDPTTGQAKAIMDAGYLTAVRTGAASGVATKYLAREDASVCTIFGAGGQAQAQLEAVHLARPLSRATVLDLNEDAAASFAASLTEKLSVEVTVGSDTEQAVREADIIVTATNAPTPLFDGDWIKEGTHINNIGSHSPGARELDTRTVVRSKYVADLKEANLAEAGDLLIPMNEGAVTEDHIYANLGDIVSGAKPGRENVDEITLFKSCGLAIQDIASAVAVYQAAVAQGVGQEFEF